MNALTIGRLARAAQTKIETIRYYERRGLLPEPPRTRGGYRQYGPDAVRRLAFIQRAQSLGFTLDEIADLLALRAQRPRDCPAVAAAAREAAARIAQKERTLSRMRRALDRLITDCEARRSTDACPILTSLEEVT